MDLLKFSKGNRKLKSLARHFKIPYTHVLGFDLPAGWTCPMADICLSKADRITGCITDGDNCMVRCYASTIESIFKDARKAHWHNFDLLKNLSSDKMAELIDASIPKVAEIIRIHASGDFFSKRYFDAWVKVAKSRPNISFFGYTKILPYVSAITPDNFNFVYSMGGKMDSKVTTEPFAKIVESVEQAVSLGLQAVCEINEWGDYPAILSGKSFALVVHGTQPAKRKKLTPKLTPELNP